MLKHNVEDDFDPDGMGIALNLSMNYEVGHCSWYVRLLYASSVSDTHLSHGWTCTISSE